MTNERTIVIREGNRATKQVAVEIGERGVMICGDYRPPMTATIHLSREEALKLATVILAAFPLDALGQI